MKRTRLCLLSALLVALGALAGATGAGARAFPVPSCGWAPAALIGQAVGEPVTALAPAWTTNIAPVLTCRYVESQPKLQLGDVALVQIEFREKQFVRPPKGAVSVSGLGSCVTSVSCPSPGQPAWLFTLDSSAAAGASPFVKLEALEVEDGLNQITIVVDNPEGPLPVGGESGSLQGLARRLLPRFFEP